MRSCRKCNAELPKSRYFHCVECVNPGDDYFSALEEWETPTAVPVNYAGTKKCTKCLTLKPKTQFHMHTGGRLRPRCKACTLTDNREAKARRGEALA